MKAEVDEFGVLCVWERLGARWIEVTLRFVAYGDEAQRCWKLRGEKVIDPPDWMIIVDCENALLRDIRQAVSDLRMLAIWCTKGGRASWLKSEPMEQSIAG